MELRSGATKNELMTERAPEKKTTADEDNKSDDSGIMELATTSPNTSRCQVARIQKTKKKIKKKKTTFGAKFDKQKVSMGRKIVKKAIKTHRKMENNRNTQNRGYDILQQLQEKGAQHQDDNKNVEFEEPPPRPPTRRCMFYRDDPEPKAVLRVKQC